MADLCAHRSRVEGFEQGGVVRGRRGAWRVLLAVVVLGGITPLARADDGLDGLLGWATSPLAPAVTEQHHLCGEEDLPETGIQGHVPKADQDSGRAEQGYNCGLEVIGHTALGAGGRPDVNANMAWAGRCAYVASSAGLSVVPQTPPSPPPGSGVAVVSVTDDGQPTHVDTLRSPGAVATAETLHAVTTPEGRSILVVGQYGNDIISGPKAMDVYDVSDPDCRKHRRIPNPDHPDDPSQPTYWWPANIHNLTLSADGRYVFATQPLQVADLSGLWDDDPRTGVVHLGNLQSAMPGPPVGVGPLANVDDVLPDALSDLGGPANAAHEAWPSADGRTLYVGGVTAAFELLSVVDIGEWLQRRPDGSPVGPPRLLSQRAGRGHSIREATIGGRRYLLHSEESVFGLAYGCLPELAAPFAGPAQPWLTDVSDPTAPRTRSQMGLEINEPEHCLDQVAAQENSSVHYHDVDDPTDTTFVMASMWNAGLRIFDVRDPEHPTEVAYFNPGDVAPGPGVVLDQAWGHVRWVPERGQVWLATARGGFWVLRLEGQVREHLDLPVDRPVDRGRPGTVGLALAGRPGLDLAPVTCTLGATLGGLVTVPPVTATLARIRPDRRST